MFLATTLVLAACGTGRDAGYCEKPADCRVGQVCDTVRKGCLAADASTFSETGPTCSVDADCHDPARPFCSADRECVGCSGAPAGPTACAARDPARPACGPSGACVECASNAECPRAKPVCSSGNACAPCSTDADCAGHPGPGVCMAHQDGRCAADDETIYVQAGGACSDASGASGGTSAAPFCSMQPTVAAVSTTRNVIVVRGAVAGAASPFSLAGDQVSILGQQSAVVTPVAANPGIAVESGDVLLRNVQVGPSAALGLQATSGSTLRLDHVVVKSNKGTETGGILLDGAAFVIENTTVTDNGPGIFGPAAWGGILINNPPAAGPARLHLVTVQGNQQVGVSCSAVVDGIGVLATGNAGNVDINSTCGFSSCGSASPTCGAQP